MSSDETHPDLFGGETPIINRGTSPYIRRKKQLQYRDAEDKSRSCKHCDHCLAYDYHDKRYYKCELIGVSNSEATDIRLKKNM